MRETLKEQGLPAGGNVTFVQARTAHEIAKAHLARLRLQRMKGELVDRARADRAGVPPGPRGARRLGQLAGAGRGADRGRARRGRPIRCRRSLETHVRAHLDELAEVRLESRMTLIFDFDGAEELLRRPGAAG